MRLALPFLLAATLHAQTAQVIQLKPEDAAQAQSLYSQKAQIEEKIRNLHNHIELTYLGTTNPSGIEFIRITPPSRDRSGSALYFIDGWDSDWLFSSDFRFITEPAHSAATCPKYSTIIPATEMEVHH